MSERLALQCLNIHPCLSIHVFTCNRPGPTMQLLEKLATANYSSYGQPLPLVIHFDRSRDNDVNSTVGRENENVKQIIMDFEWPHGPKLLDVKPKHMGLKASWLSAWVDPDPNDIMIALEDDMHVSPLYFEWLLHTLTGYNLLDAQTRDR